MPVPFLDFSKEQPALTRQSAQHQQALEALELVPAVIPAPSSLPELVSAPKSSLVEDLLWDPREVLDSLQLLLSLVQASELALGLAISQRLPVTRVSRRAPDSPTRLVGTRLAREASPTMWEGQTVARTGTAVLMATPRASA